MREFFFIPLLFSASFLFSQTKLDSLRSELEECKTDTGKISILIALTYNAGEYSDQINFSKKAFNLGLNVTSVKHKSRSEIVYGSYLAETKLDSGLSLIRLGINRYLKEGMDDYAANAIFVKGVTFEILSMYDSAISTYESLHMMASAKKIHPQWGDAAYALAYLNNNRGNNVEALKWAFEAKRAYTESENLKKTGQVLNQIGIIYDQQGLYSEALNNYLQALDYAIEYQDIDGEILIHNNIGVIYDNMNNNELAMKYYSNGLEKARINNLKADEATLLNNLSYIHLSNGDTVRGMQLLRRSLRIDLTKTDPCFESYPLEGLGSVFIAQGKLDSAEHLFNKALTLAKKCDDILVQVTVLKGLGEVYLKKERYNDAHESFYTSLELSSSSSLPAEMKQALFSLYQFHKKTGSTSLSLMYLEKYQSLSDSLNDQNNIEKATQLAAEYDFRKQTAKMERERALIEQEMSQEIEAKILENRLILFGVCLVLILVFVLIRAYVIIKKNNSRLQYLNEEKNKLIGIVAHDLRNPLNMIQGILPLVEETQKNVEDPYFPKYVEILNSSSDKMAGMIERVLDISAIENMRLNLKAEKTDLSSLTKKSISNFSAIAEQKKVALIDEIEESEGHFSQVDPNYLEQAIDNLISNAIKFSETGKKVFVSLTKEDTTNVIQVRDEGPGISEDEKKNLFKAFTTASSKPTANEVSTGLGLSIALKFIKAMNGNIEVDTELGKGTTFKVLLATY